MRALGPCFGVLQCLDLADNYLAATSASLAQLTELRSLRQLDLSMCCLTSLPSVLLENGNLEVCVGCRQAES